MFGSQRNDSVEKARHRLADLFLCKRTSSRGRDRRRTTRWGLRFLLQVVRPPSGSASRINVPQPTAAGSSGLTSPSAKASVRSLATCCLIARPAQTPSFPPIPPSDSSAALSVEPTSFPGWRGTPQTRPLPRLKWSWDTGFARAAPTASMGRRSSCAASCAMAKKGQFLILIHETPKATLPSWPAS